MTANTETVVSPLVGDNAHGMDKATIPRGAMRRKQKIMWILVAVGLVLVAYTQFGQWWGSYLQPPVKFKGTLESWAAITIAVCIQSLPFLVLGVTVSAVIAAFAPVGFLQKVTPKNQFLAVPVASGVSMFLPGCECASVPVAQSFMRAGVSRGAALVFMLASPALNPVVIVSTAVAFYAAPTMVWARFGASLLAVLLAGWLWVVIGRDDMIKLTPAARGGCDDACAPELAGDHEQSLAAQKRRRQWSVFRTTALHDLSTAGGFLALGAMVAGVIKVLVPATWFIKVSSSPGLAILVMAGVAILLSLCSEADAFVAASFTAVSPTAQLAFLVIGPMIDIKLFSMQVGAFGWKFVRVFLPLVAVCCLLSSAFVGFLLFGQL